MNLTLILHHPLLHRDSILAGNVASRTKITRPFSVAGMWTGYALSELRGGAIVYRWQTTKRGEESALPAAWDFIISPSLYADIREITCGLS